MPASPTTITGSATAPTTRWIPRSRRRAEARGSGSLISIPATTRPTNRFPNTCARISRIISSTPTSRTMRRIGRRERLQQFQPRLRHAQHSGRRDRAGPQAVRLRAERRDRPGSGRQPGRAVQQQHHRAGIRLRPRPVQIGRDARPCREHEHGRPSVPGMGGRNQRALRRRRRRRNRGRKQLWQRADACRRLSGAIRPGHRGLRRDGGRRPIRKSPVEADGRQLRSGRQDADGDCGATPRTCRGRGSASRRSWISTATAPRRRRPRWPQRRRCGSTSIAPTTTPIEKAGCASRRCGRRCSRAPPRATPATAPELGAGMLRAADALALRRGAGFATGCDAP